MSSDMPLDTAVGSVVAAAAAGLAMYLAGTQIAAVRAERLAVELDFKSKKAALELENAELRVRRDVSDTLHGRIQQRLVFLAAQVDQAIPMVKQGEPDQTVELLQDVAKALDQLRETDVRQLSHSIFPVGVDIGLSQALELQVGRVPPEIKVELEISAAVAQLDDILEPQIDLTERVLLAQVVEEGVTNAIKHGRASRISISLSASEPAKAGQAPERLQVEIGCDGEPPPTNPVFSGLGALKARVEQRGGDLTLASQPDGTTVLRAWIKHQPAPPA
jgi:signal transduction histidine kinase